MIVYDDLEQFEKVKVYDRGVDILGDSESTHQMKVSYRMGDMWSPKVDGTEALAVEIEHFRLCIETNSEPETNGLKGLELVRILEAADQSMLGKGSPVDIL